VKVKIDFITNSSSTAFIITNTSDTVKTLVDFVIENPQLLEQFKEDYGWYKNNPRFHLVSLIESAAKNFTETFQPGEAKYCVFGDEQGTVVGIVFDYILRDGGRSENFIWEFKEWLR